MLFGDGKKGLARLRGRLTRIKEAMMTGNDYPTWRGLIGPEFDDTPIPSFLRPRPTTDTPEGVRLVLETIDNRIEWLAQRGLWAHPDVLARREEVAAIVARFHEEEKQKPQ